MGALPSSSFIECSHCPWPLNNWGRLAARGAGGRVLRVEISGRDLILTLPGSGSEFPLL